MKKTYALIIFMLGIISMAVSQNDFWTRYTTSNSSISHDTVNAILIDNANRKWFATVSGISRLSHSGWKQELLRSALSMAIDSAGNTWVGLEKGLVRFDPAGTATLYSPGPDLPAFDITSIAIDANNNIWVATRGGGIVMNPHANAVLFNSDNSALPGNIVTAIEVDRNNIVWAGTELAGLGAFDGSSWTVYNTSNSGLPDNNITSIAVDGKNNKWIGTGNGGLVKLNGAVLTVYNPDNSDIPGAKVSAVEIDNSGKVWIGTEENGAAAFNGDSWTIYSAANSGLSSNEITSLALDKANGVWFGTATMGAIRLCNGPSITITSSKQGACQGNSVTLTATGGNYNYQWQLNGNAIQNATSATHNATESGSYSVIVHDTTACSSTSQPVQVIIHPLPPVPTVSQSAGVLASSVPGGNQWSFNGNPIAGATGQLYTPTQDGFYTVSVTDANGCTSTSAPFTFQSTGIEEKKSEAVSAKVYPNPSDGQFSVQLSSSETKIVSLTLNDILGNVVWRENVSEKSNTEIEVDVTGITPGVYFLNINTTGRTFTKKISIR